ncbi:MAG: hypothetical protein OXI22_09425 [Defluviicoccus sp.]|nr:hypothetical protein [Defluviicoccus sp.]MDE0384093.1 hypothetical protein [Defluviicoccus sp.]
MTSKRAAAVSLAAALVLALGACGGDGPARKAPDLALACQTMDCVCTGDPETLFAAERKTEVLWRANGDAYCPDGFALEPAGG